MAHWLLVNMPITKEENDKNYSLSIVLTAMDQKNSKA